MRPAVCRRGHRRYALSPGAEATVEFGYPEPDGYACAMALKDLSASGLSVTLAHELPGLEPGRAIAGATVRVRGRAFRGDLLVMHLTPDATPGSVFGALFFPASDGDLLVLRETVAALEADEPVAAPAAAEP